MKEQLISKWNAALQASLQGAETQKRMLAQYTGLGSMDCEEEAHEARASINRINVKIMLVRQFITDLEKM